MGSFFSGVAGHSYGSFSKETYSCLKLILSITICLAERDLYYGCSLTLWEKEKPVDHKDEGSTDFLHPLNIFVWEWRMSEEVLLEIKKWWKQTMGQDWEVKFHIIGK